MARNRLVRTPVAGCLVTCAAIGDADLTELTSTLKLPTLCVAGTVDGAAPPELVRAKAEMIEGAGNQEIDRIRPETYGGQFDSTIRFMGRSMPIASRSQYLISAVATHYLSALGS